MTLRCCLGVDDITSEGVVRHPITWSFIIGIRIRSETGRRADVEDVVLKGVSRPAMKLHAPLTHAINDIICDGDIRGIVVEINSLRPVVELAVITDNIVPDADIGAASQWLPQIDGATVGDRATGVVDGVLRDRHVVYPTAAAPVGVKVDAVVIGAVDEIMGDLGAGVIAAAPHDRGLGPGSAQRVQNGIAIDDHVSSMARAQPDGDIGEVAHCDPAQGDIIGGNTDRGVDRATSLKNWRLTGIAQPGLTLVCAQ